jgi:hypothetical protein
MKTFFIELISVYKQKDPGPYPRCTNKRGEVVENITQDPSSEEDEELRSQLLQDFEDLLDDSLDLPNEST